MAQDVQPNKPLSGKELKDIIVNDITSILEQDGMLASHIAYNQVAYSVTIKIMTNNPIIPNWTNKAISKKSTEQQVIDNESFAAVDVFPLKREQSDEAFDIGVERTRKIVSPNQSRIENGLKVPVSRKTQAGETVEENVSYEVDDLPDDNPYADEVTERELTPAEVVTKEG